MTKINELEKLKEEILSEVGATKKEAKTLHWNSLAVYIVLIVLAFLTVAQTVQSAVILNKINNGVIAPSGSNITPSSNNLQNLPDMVGGC